MYMEEGNVEGKSFAGAPYLYTAIALSVIGILLLGVVPSPMLELSRLSFLSLR
jgi:hypothetical protein